MKYLGVILAGNNLFDHVIDTLADSTHIQNMDGETIYTVDSSCQVFDSEDRRIGSFRTYGRNWLYRPSTGPLIYTEHTDLLGAERLVFQILLETK